jgi:arginyl-tRNA synthetase
VKENETVFEKSDGAVIFKGEKFGLHTRVFVNSLKLPTYEAKELGLAVKKYSDFPFDLCLNVTGNEINEYFKVVLCALSQIKPELASKIKHMGHGMVRLPQGKMSSRTGKVLTAEWLLDEVKQNVYDVLSKSETKYAKEVQEEIAEKATVAAIKYSFLKVALPSNIAFDLEKSVSFEGDSGPYLLYTYARCKSVLRKAGTGKQKTEDGGQNTEVLNPSSVVRLLSSSLNPEEHSLARLILLFPDVVSQAAEKFAPSILCTFLYDVAQAYNLFYAKHKILNPKSKIQNSKSNSNIKTELVITTEQSQFRLALTAASAQVLKNGLNLLGIATVERM